MIAEIERVVDDTVREFRRRGAPGDPEDMRQQAWLESLESLSRFNPKKGNIGAYLYPGCKRSIGKAISRELACVHVARRKLTEARNYTATDAVADRIDSTTPEDSVLEAETNHLRRRAVETILTEMRADMALIMREIMACDGTGERNERVPGIVAKRLNVPIKRVYRARYEFIKRAAASAELRATQ